MNAKSQAILLSVHPDLAKILSAAMSMSSVSFELTEGRRTLARQKQLLAAGATTTLHSRHVAEMNQCGVACAADVVAMVGGKVRWDWPLYRGIAAVVKQAAMSLSLPIEWGGDWEKFADGPHFQLPWKEYP